MNEEIEKTLKNLNLVVLMHFGSKLYGTDTPESDVDYKGIYIPTWEQIVLGTAPKTIKLDSKKSKKQGEKNTKDDIDCELYSLSYFIHLCLKGETVGIDMLHVNKENILTTTPLWGYIQENRSLFYTRKLNALVSYCKKQAAKYGIKGSRIAAARTVKKFLEDEQGKYWQEDEVHPDKFIRLGEIWDELPVGEHVKFVTGGKPERPEEFYQVCDKKLQKTSTVIYCIDILEKFISSYGARALKAERNEGIDWKAVSHAIRFAGQIKSIFLTGDITFPLDDREYILRVKKGELHYLKEVAPKLEELLEEIDELAKKSELPEKPNREFFEQLLLSVYANEVIGA